MEIRHNAALAVLPVVMLLTAGLVPADRPRVAKTVPETATHDVDPELREIRIVFDQPMDTEAGYSIVGGGPLFPKVLGRPQWIDDHTLILRVQLEPGHDYHLSVNSDRFANCRGKNSLPAVPYPLSFQTKATAAGADHSRQSAKRLTPQQNRESVQRLRQAIDDNYSYRDLRHVDWNRQFSVYSARLEAARTPLEFGTLVAKLLEPADDLHLSIEAEGRVLYPWNGTVPSANFNLSNLPKLVPQWTEQSQIIATGSFSTGPDYLLVRLWDAGRVSDLQYACDLLRHADPKRGLIIDVRPNGGGDEPMARQLAGCFIDSSRVYARNDIRSNGEFLGPFDRVLEPNPRAPHFKGKIAVLMGPRCVSSNEDFLLMMKTVPCCKLVGARSRGASGNPKPFALLNDVTVNLSSWRDMLPDGACFEGSGIAPDIEVRTTPGDFDGQDPVLQAALRYLSG